MSFTIVKPTISNFKFTHNTSNIDNYCNFTHDINILYQNCPATLSWDFNNLYTTTVDLQLWKNNTKIKDIVTNHDINQSFVFLQDSSATLINNDYYFKITDNNNIADDISTNKFQINKASFTNVQIPSSLTPCQTGVNITWDFDLSINKVKLQIFDNYGYIEDIVSDLSASDKSYSWDTPARNILVGKDLHIKIFDLSSIAVALPSSNFRFNRPSFNMFKTYLGSSAYTREDVLHGEPFKIHWEHTLIIKSLYIKLTNPSNNQLVYTIATNYDTQGNNSGSVEFTIPLNRLDLSGNYNVEINDSNNVATNVVSNMKLIAPEFISFNSKTSKIYQGISGECLWNLQGNISNVGIDLYDSNDNFIKNVGNNILAENKTYEFILDNSGTLFGTGYYFKIRDILNNATSIDSKSNLNYVVEIIKPQFNKPIVDSTIAQGSKYSLFLKSNGLILDNTKVELWRKGTPDISYNVVANNIDITNRNSDNIVVFNENYLHSTSVPFIPAISNTLVGENFYFKIIDENQITDDVSSNYFEIVTAEFTNLNIQLSSSNTSNKMLQGLPSYIYWEYKYTIANIKLDLIKSDGTLVTPIISPLNVNNDSLAGIRGGTYNNWTPDFNDYSGNNFKIQISDVDNIVPDYSSNVFEIIPPKIKSLTVPNIIKQSFEYTVNWDYSGNINTIKLELKKQGTSNLIDMGLNNLTSSTKTYNFTLALNKDLQGTYTIIITDIATHSNATTYESTNFTIEKPEFLNIELKHPTSKTYDWCPDNPDQNKAYQCCPIDISFNKNDIPIDKINIQLWRTNQLNMIEELDNSQISFYPSSNIEFGIRNFGSTDPVKFYIEQSWDHPTWTPSLPTVEKWSYQRWVSQINRTHTFILTQSDLDISNYVNENVVYMTLSFSYTQNIPVTCNYYRYVWEDVDGFTFKYVVAENKIFSSPETINTYFKFNNMKSFWNKTLGAHGQNLRAARTGKEIHIAEITQRISSKITSSRTDNKYLFKWTPEKNKNNINNDYYIKLVDSANIADDISSSTFSIVKSSFTSLNIKKNNIIITDVSQNEDVNISWSYDLSINKVSIELIKDSYIEILSSSFNAYNKSFPWKPNLSNSIFGSNYKLRIKDVDDIANYDESSPFNIIKPFFSINKSDIFNQSEIYLGLTYEIYWIHEILMKKVKITLMKDSQTILVIKDSYDVDEWNLDSKRADFPRILYEWKPELNTNNINNLVGNDFYIQLTDLDGFADDISSNKFNILVNEFKLITINSILYQNKQSTVTWDYDGNIKSVKIDLYKNAIFQKNIKNKVDVSLKTLNFTLDLSKNMFGNNFKLKITDLSGFSANSPFSNSFNIVKPEFNKIELFHPNISVNFCRNMTKDLLHETCPVDISWNTNGLTIDNVKLELWANTANDPVKVKDIANSVDTNGKDNDDYTDDKFIHRFNDGQKELTNLLLPSHTNYYLKIKDNQNFADDLSSSTINIFKNVFKDITVNTLSNIPITDVSQNITVKIIWNYTVNTNNNATLDLLNPDNSVRQTLKNNLNIGDGSYNWLPDLSGTMFGNNFKIRISDNGALGHSIPSSPFKIIKPSFDLLKNNIITTRVLHGISVPISWSYLLTIKNIKLTLMKNTQTILEIRNPLNIGSHSSGNYDWTLPLTNTNNSDISGTNYYILMSDLSGNANDISSNHFELISPKFQNLSLTTPVQQEIESKISWDYSGNISNAKLELWKNTSKVKDITIYNTENCFDCSFGWTEDNSKNLFGTNYYLKLKDVSNNSTDISSNFFEIIKPKIITLNIDHSVLNQEQTTNIKWQTNGLKINTVKIEMWDYSGNLEIKDITTKNTTQTTLSASQLEYSHPFKQEKNKDICGNTFYFKIFDLSDIAIDISSEKFTIIKPYFNELKLENSSTKVKQGDSININWNFEIKQIFDIKLELVKPDNTTIVIKDTTKSGILQVDPKNYNWTIPYDDISGTGFKLKITDLGNIADDFISPLSFEIIAPKFSSFVIPTVVYQNRPYNLRWDYSGNINTVSIKLKDANNNIIDISKTVIASTKQFPWTPDLSKDLHGTFTMDISDNATHATTLQSNLFTIIKPEFNNIELKHPNSGPTWCPSNPLQNTVYQECPIDISWNTNNSTIDNVKLELWRNNNPLKIISSDFNTSGKANDNDLTNDVFKFTWTQDNSANAIYDDYYIRIFDLSDIALDISSSTFSIVKPEFLDININNTQEQPVSVVNQDENYKIKWNFDLSLNNIKIDLSSNTFKRTIVDNYKASDLSYNWTPILHKDMFGTTFKLHIHDKSNITNDISSVQFEIKKPIIGPVKLVDITTPTTDVSQNVPINIVWQTFLTIEFAQIILTNNNGDFIQTIVDSIPGDNDFNKFGNELSNFPWTPDLSANMFGSGFRLKIIDLAGISEPSHPSNTFTIIKPIIGPVKLVDIDNPATDASQNVPINIVWKKKLTVKNVQIILTNANGDFIQTIVDSIPGDNDFNKFGKENLNFLWTPDLSANIFGPGFRLKIIDLAGISEPWHHPTQFTLHKNNFTSLTVANLVQQNVNTNLNWDFDLSVNNVQLELWSTLTTPHERKQIIDTNIKASKKNYNWNPDLSSNLSGNGFKILIKDVDSITEDYSSNIFQIEKSSFSNLKVSNYVIQDIETIITWKHNLTIENVNLELYDSSNNTFVESIVINQLNTNSYHWKPSNTILGSNFHIVIKDSLEVADDISSNTFLIIKKSFNPFLFFNNPMNTFHGQGVNMIKYERKNINDLSFNVYTLLGNISITRINTSITNIPNTAHMILEDDDIFDGSGNTITYLVKDNNVPGLFYNDSNGTSYTDGSSTRNGFLIENLQLYPPGNELTNIGKLGISHGSFINYDSIKNKSLWCTIKNCLVNKGTYNIDSDNKTNAAPYVGDLSFNKNNGGFVKIELCASKWLPLDISKNKILVNNNPSAFASYGFGENKTNFVNGTDVSNICILKECVVYGDKPTFNNNDDILAVFKNFNINENNSKLKILNCYFYDTLNQQIINGDTPDEQLTLYGVD